MRELRPRPNLDQLRRQASELLRAAQSGDVEATERLARLSVSPTLAGAQLVVARDYGFASWPKLKAEIEQRRAEPLRFVIRYVRSPEELRHLWRVISVILGLPSALERPHWHVFDDFGAKRTCMLVVEHAGRIIGGAIELRLIALEPWARGIGLGTRVMQTVEAELLAKGRSLRTHADPENKGFFRQLGYTDHGKSKLHMHKGVPLSRRLVERRLQQWRHRAGDLESGVSVGVDRAPAKCGRCHGEENQSPS